MTVRRPLSFLALTVLALALGGCGRPSTRQWNDLGGCVWKRLPAADRAAVARVVEAGQPVTQAGGPDFRDRTRKLAFACTPGAQLDDERAGRIVVLALAREAAVQIIEQRMHLDRRRLEVAVDTAPPQVKTSLRNTGLMAAAGGQPVLMTSLAPIQANLGLPQDEAFADTAQGRLLTRYVVADATIKALAEDGGR